MTLSVRIGQKAQHYPPGIRVPVILDEVRRAKLSGAAAQAVADRAMLEVVKKDQEVKCIACGSKSIELVHGFGIYTCSQPMCRFYIRAFRPPKRSL